MKLRQLQYVHEVVRNGLSVSRAARALHTSQPGVSQQIRALEEELRLELFSRDRNRLVGLTPSGEIIVGHIATVLTNIHHIQQLAESRTREAMEELSIVTTHTQARYILPDVLKAFSASHPHVRISVRHCNVIEVITEMSRGDADIGLCPIDDGSFQDVFVFNCHDYRRILVAPPGHPLLGHTELDLKDIAAYPLVMYEQSVPTRQQFIDVFARAGITPNVALNAINSDVIKACVESGLGIAIVPEFVYSRERDSGLRAMDTGNLFPPAHTKIAVHRKRPLRSHMVDFIQLLAPDWNRARIEAGLHPQAPKRRP
jgi:LysR family cys regulon transcriptional activator